jgi:hypothetical protein
MITVRTNWTPVSGNTTYAGAGTAVATPDSGVKAGATPHKIAGNPGTGKIRPGAGEV